MRVGADSYPSSVWHSLIQTPPPSMPMAYCLRDLPLVAQLLIDDFRRHWLDLAYLRASGGTPSARAMKAVRWQHRCLHPEGNYPRYIKYYWGGAGRWRLRSDHHQLFIVHKNTLEPGRPGYGRAHRYHQIHLEASPTDDYSDVEHYSFGWLTDLDGEQQFESEDEEESEVEDD